MGSGPPVGATRRHAGRQAGGPHLSVDHARDRPDAGAPGFGRPPELAALPPLSGAAAVYAAGEGAPPPPLVAYSKARTEPGRRGTEPDGLHIMCYSWSVILFCF